MVPNSGEHAEEPGRSYVQAVSPAGTAGEKWDFGSFLFDERETAGHGGEPLKHLTQSEVQ